jgi:hypothetical protein
VFRWEPSNLHRKKKRDLVCYEMLHWDSYLENFCKRVNKILGLINDVVSWLVELLSASQGRLCSKECLVNHSPRSTTTNYNTYFEFYFKCNLFNIVELRVSIGRVIPSGDK